MYREHEQAGHDKCADNHTSDGGEAAAPLGAARRGGACLPARLPLVAIHVSHACSFPSSSEVDQTFEARRAKRVLELGGEPGVAIEQQENSETAERQRGDDDNAAQVPPEEPKRPGQLTDVLASSFPCA